MNQWEVIDCVGIVIVMIVLYDVYESMVTSSWADMIVTMIDSPGLFTSSRLRWLLWLFQVILRCIYYVTVCIECVCLVSLIEMIIWIYLLDVITFIFDMSEWLDRNVVISLWYCINLVSRCIWVWWYSMTIGCIDLIDTLICIFDFGDIKNIHHCIECIQCWH